MILDDMRPTSPPAIVLDEAMRSARKGSTAWPALIRPETADKASTMKLPMTREMFGAFSLSDVGIIMSFAMIAWAGRAPKRKGEVKKKRGTDQRVRATPSRERCAAIRKSRPDLGIRWELLELLCALR